MTRKNNKSAELAQLIYKVLNHPDIPPGLYNGFSEALTDFQNESLRYSELLESVEVIQKSLDMYFAGRRKKGGG